MNHTRSGTERKICTSSPLKEAHRASDLHTRARRRQPNQPTVRPALQSTGLSMCRSVSAPYVQWQPTNQAAHKTESPYGTSVPPSTRPHTAAHPTTRSSTHQLPRSSALPTLHGERVSGIKQDGHKKMSNDSGAGF